MIMEVGYYQHGRKELIELVEKDGSVVLELGCAEGFLGESLKKSGRAKEVVGVELVSDVAEAARKRLDKVICGDLSKIEFSDFGIKNKYFDYIIAGDVFEHLIDPWTVVSNLSALLKDDGCIISSIPNVRYWKVSLGLLFKGKWEYVNSGIMDRTHLRFFTRRSAIQLLEDNGSFEILSVIPHGIQKQYGMAAWLVNMLSIGLFEGLLVSQYIIVSRKK